MHWLTAVPTVAGITKPLVPRQNSLGQIVDEVLNAICPTAVPTAAGKRKSRVSRQNSPRQITKRWTPIYSHLRQGTVSVEKSEMPLRTLAA